MDIAYFGTPIFSAHLLEKLINEKGLPIHIKLVVTQPDKPVGKKQIMTPSPVKVIAQKYGIEIWDKPIAKSNVSTKGRSTSGRKGQSEDAGIFSTQSRASAQRGEHECGDKNDSIELFNKLKKIDLSIVYAFGFKQLISLDLLRAPKIQFKIGEGKTSGFINVHPSLLPRYRGSSPIAYPILLSENKTGVTLFVMDEKMDHGPVIAQEETEIRLNDVRPDMEKKLTDLGFEMIRKMFNSLTREPVNSLTLKTQNDSSATRAPYMNRDDGFIPFSTLQKALKNEALTLHELPHIIRNYLEKYPHELSANNDIFLTQSRAVKNMCMSEHECGDKNDIIGASRQNLLQTSSLIIYNFWRGMLPWPGVWTKILINNEERRLKITEMRYENNQLLIAKVQLEGKNEIDFPTFNKAYQIFEV